MAEYRIEHKRVHCDPTVRILKLRKGEKVLAEAKYSENRIQWLEGRTNKEFVRQFRRTPAMELIMHVAHHSEKKTGWQRPSKCTWLIRSS